MDSVLYTVQRVKNRPLRSGARAEGVYRTLRIPVLPLSVRACPLLYTRAQ